MKNVGLYEKTKCTLRTVHSLPTMTIVLRFKPKPIWKIIVKILATQTDENGYTIISFFRFSRWFDRLLILSMEHHWGLQNNKVMKTKLVQHIKTTHTLISKEKKHRILIRVPFFPYRQIYNHRDMHRFFCHDELDIITA